METPDHRPIKEVDCCGVAAELAGRCDHELLSFPSHQHHSQSSTPLGKFARSIDHVHLAVISTTATPARCFNLTHAMGIVACFLSLSMFRHFRESLLQYPLLLASLGTGGGEHQRRPNGANQKTRQDHRSYSIPLLECFPRPCR
jgi:hypothetical protein